MKRRSFFRSLGAIVAGTYLACHVKLIETVATIKEKATIGLYVNPDWVTAKYEVAFVMGKEYPVKSIVPIVYKRTPGQELPEGFQRIDSFPMRFNEDKKVINPTIDHYEPIPTWK